MKNLLLIAVLFISGLVKATEINHQFTPNKNVITKVNVAVYFVTQNPENYDWVKWDFGDGQIEYSINPAHKYAKSGIYDVKMIVSKGSQVDTICKNAFVTILPNGTATEAGDYALDLDLSKETYYNLQIENDGTLSTNLENYSIQFLNKTSSNGSLEIKNIYGDVLFQTEINSHDEMKSIETSGLSKGIYIVSVTMNNNISLYKIFKN